MRITTYSLGATGEVTGSKHILEVDGKSYMVDCGAWQGTSEATAKNKTFEFPVEKLSGVFLTHAHFDHCGLLPKLIKDGYTGNIYSTPATRDLASIVMMDSAKIQKYEDDAAYEEKDVIETVNHFRCHAYHKEKRINDTITYTAYDAGHILGSALLDIKVTPKPNFLEKLFRKTVTPKHILFTGDLGRKDNPITKEPETKDIPAPDYIYLESTYGNRLHNDREQSIEKLADIINATFENGGKVIIPSFAIERAQEIIYYVKVLMMKKRIPKVPVYVDSPMASSATGVFSIHPECFNHVLTDRFLSRGKNPFSVSTLRFITSYQESVALAKKQQPCIVIAANGMCEAGRIINHLKGGLENYNNTVVLVGYMAENTLGRKLLDGATDVVIDEKEYMVKAHIENIDAFSAHADYNEIKSWLNDLDTSKLKKIFLVHGDTEALASLQTLLTSEGYKVEIVKNNEKYAL